MDIKNYEFFNKLIKLPFVQSIWLYGSRARKDNQERSDIDLAIICPAATNEQWLEVLEVLDNADTLFNIDCVRFDTLADDETIKLNILKDKVVLFTKDDENAAWKQNFYDLGEALERLGEAISAIPDEHRFVIDASIQRFEFCIELFWKNFKNLAKMEGKEVLSPKQSLSTAFQMKWIDDEKMWLNMLQDRNITSHTYKKFNADIIYSHIKAYYPTLRTTYNSLKERYIYNDK